MQTVAFYNNACLRELQPSIGGGMQWLSAATAAATPRLPTPDDGAYLIRAATASGLPLCD